MMFPELGQKLNIKRKAAFESACIGREALDISMFKEFGTTRELVRYVESELDKYSSSYEYRMDVILGAFIRQVVRGETILSSNDETLVLLTFIDKKEIQVHAFYTGGLKS